MRLLFLNLCILFQLTIGLGQDDLKSNKSSAWSYLNTTFTINESNKKPILIAVIDDGFRLSHKSLKGFIYQNNKEIPFNNIDDDKNGYLDDINGYDLSNNDNNVTSPEENISRFAHGTFIAGTISNCLKDLFGTEAKEHFKILPIKAVSDQGNPDIILDGYKGIEYATKLGADVIVCAWNGGSVTSEETKIVQDAYEKGITILSSAGNAYSDLAQPPASLNNVIAVAALDTSGKKLPMSNFGSLVDVSAPGEAWMSPHISSDTSYFEGKGTSLAVALTAAVTAAMKNQNPNLSPLELRGILKNSSFSLEYISPRKKGKMGAGFLNPGLALKMAIDPSIQESQFNSSLPEGLIYMGAKEKNYSFERVIKPTGDFHQTAFKLEYLEPFDSNLAIDIMKGDSIILSWGPLDLLTTKSVNETGLKVILKPSLPDVTIMLSYASELLDSTNYYCSEQVDLVQVKTITDESGEFNYVNNTNCKWLLTAPPNHRISFIFSEFDTEAKTDFVHLFDGHKPLQTAMIAKFSGPKIPPEVTSRSNQVLVWFLSDEENTGEGWKLNFSFIPNGN